MNTHFMGGGEIYLAPPHIFEWGGGSDTPRPPCSDAPTVL